ncbi:GAF domain-containing protein [Geodermatophilus normandii]|uniref:GAF domain-containing protein n=1 Tax=Geodermatophilus normandii TaxID=1137989 RepID=UPI001952FCCA
MTVVEEFRIAVAAAAAELAGPELLPERLARACARVLPVDGAGICLFFAEDRRLPLGASDPAASTAERLQFTAGSGPCLSAHAEGRPQVADEVTIRSRWPAFYDGLVTRTPIRGIISLPLGDELRDIGALDLYTVPPNDVTALSLADALDISAEVTSTFRAHGQATRRHSDTPVWLDAPSAERRSIVWQAMGFLNSGLDVSSSDALAILRAHAYGYGEDLDQLARRVVDGEIPLERLALDHDSAS